MFFQFVNKPRIISVLVEAKAEDSDSESLNNSRFLNVGPAEIRQSNQQIIARFTYETSLMANQ